MTVGRVRVIDIFKPGTLLTNGRLHPRLVGIAAIPPEISAVQWRFNCIALGGTIRREAFIFEQWDTLC
jgi:hypothetical protein